MVVQCPQCGTGHIVDPEELDRGTEVTMECTKCQTSFALRAGGKGAEETSRGAGGREKSEAITVMRTTTKLPRGKNAGGHAGSYGGDCLSFSKAGSGHWMCWHRRCRGGPRSFSNALRGGSAWELRSLDGFGKHQRNLRGRGTRQDIPAGTPQRISHRRNHVDVHDYARYLETRGRELWMVVDSCGNVEKKFLDNCGCGLIKGSAITQRVLEVTRRHDNDPPHLRSPAGCLDG